MHQRAIRDELDRFFDICLLIDAFAGLTVSPRLDKNDFQPTPRGDDRSRVNRVALKHDLHRVRKFVRLIRAVR
jgi:hypothetical protein